MKKTIWIILLMLPVITKAPHINDKLFNSQIAYQKKLITNKQNEEYFQQFLTKLRYKESSNNWKIINRFGYMGYYQFGDAALKTLGYGYITTKKFKKNPYIFPPKLQHEVVKKLLKYNSKKLRLYYKYIGCSVNHIYITESGLLAAAHLGGAGNVIKFLNSNGKKDFNDGNGTKISNYLIEFSNYKININED